MLSKTGTFGNARRDVAYIVTSKKYKQYLIYLYPSLVLFSSANQGPRMLTLSSGNNGHN